MVDPLAEVVSLLQPGAPFSKVVVASAPWAVRRTEMGRPRPRSLLGLGSHVPRMPAGKWPRRRTTKSTARRGVLAGGTADFD